MLPPVNMVGCYWKTESFSEILCADDVLGEDAAVGTADAVLVRHFDFLETGLAEGVAAAEDARDFVVLVVLEEAD